MTRLMWFLPVAALTFAAGIIGYQLGRDVTDTEIITHYADRYVSDFGAGARVTDCLARPVALEGIRMVIYCTHMDGRDWQAVVDQRGRIVDEPALEGPVT